MKISSYILLAFFLFSASLNAQDFGDLMELANDTFGEGEETKAGSWEDIEKEIDKKLNDPKIKEMMGNFSEAFNKFSEESQTGKCLQLMGAYAEMLAYCDMRAETEGDPCKRKDWYGIESMILFMGTSISYCPQEFYGLADFDDPDEDEQIKIVSQYEAEINVYFFGDFIKVSKEVGVFENFKIHDNIGIWWDKNYSQVAEYKKWDEMTQKEQREIFILLNILMKGYPYLDKEYGGDPHLQLYFKFMKANEQLDLLEEEIDGKIKVGYVIDFVSKMFTPGYQISKALEIASESSSINCNN